MAGPLDYVSSTPGVAMDPYLMMGLGILGSASKPETLGPNIMQSLVMANQARQGQAQNLLAQQQIAQAGQWENFVATLPPGDQELMRAMGPSAGGKYYLEQINKRKQDMDRLNLLRTIPDPALRAAAAVDPEAYAAARFKAPPAPSNAMKVYQESGGEAGTGKGFADWYNEDYKGAGTTVSVNTGSIPSGFVQEETPEGLRLSPISGSPEDVERREGLIALEGVYTDISELEQLVKEHGTEVYGDVARRMAALRNRIVGNIPAVRQTGVLQEGELKRIEDELPSGNSLLKPGFAILPLLSGFREEVERTLGAKRQLYGMDPVVPSGQSPGAASGWSIVR